jgi:hypothetical protein
MDKNKDVYMNYVCPYCWNTLDNCTCKLFPPYHLIYIDKNIQEHIRILNEKGYRTMACCEGHKDVCINTYIAFANNYFKDIDTPEGFEYDKKRRIITYTYSAKLEEKEMEELKKEKLKTLLNWCKSLPNRNMEN